MSPNDAKIKSIHFFAPCRVVGGGVTACVRFAETLVKEHGIKVFYIDYEDGSAQGLVNSQEITFVKYIEGEIISIDEDTHLLTFLHYLDMVREDIQLTSNSKLLFWSISPESFSWLSKDVSMSYRTFCKQLSDKSSRLILQTLNEPHWNYLQTLIQKLNDNNALCLTELQTYMALKDVLEVNLPNDCYIPIPISRDNNVCNNGIISKEEINIAWLGRLEEDKYCCLLNILENANHYSQKYNKIINLHIIGYGSLEEQVKSLQVNEKLNVIFTGKIVQNELNNYINQNIDILFAQGTSCLEAAKLGIPSVPLDWSWSKMPIDLIKFRWLFESDGFCVGSYLSEALFEEPLVQAPHNFDEIINHISSDQMKHETGQLCLKYALSNHSIEASTKHLLQHLQLTKLTPEILNDLPSLPQDTPGKLQKLITVTYKIIKNILRIIWSPILLAQFMITCITTAFSQFTRFLYILVTKLPTALRLILISNLPKKERKFLLETLKSLLLNRLST
jgi:hypothetical protein